ncbi:MAG TPA: ferredoxin reductase family protein [Propionibacteriaceae bacterium]|nr:ferredoxin reductase family protein [Propionibacteriaceae bacterium]
MRPPGITAITLVVVVYLGAALAVLQGFVSGGLPIDFGASLVAQVSGMAAGYGAAIMLILLSRSPWLERGVGAGRLARWHAWGAPLVIILTVLHAVAAVAAWAEVESIDLVAATNQVLNLPGLMTALVGTVILVLIGVTSIRAVRRRVSYERWHFLHLLTYLAVGFGFVHQLAGPDLVGRRWLQIAWALLYCYAFALVLRWRVFQPIFQLWRHRLRVEDVRQESEDVMSVLMSGQHLDELRAEPGQFFRWRFLTRETWRSAYPFSLSAPPTRHRLRITIKASGDGTRRLFAVPRGTLVFAEGPYGVITSRRRRRPRVLLIAGGVGITPMRSLFEVIDLPGKDITLVYRASKEQDLVFKHELDEIAERSGARVVYLVGPSSDTANDISAHALNRIVGDVRDHDVYLCASPGLAARVRGSLMDSGLPRHQLHEERFSL